MPTQRRPVGAESISPDASSASREIKTAIVPDDRSVAAAARTLWFGPVAPRLVLGFVPPDRDVSRTASAVRAAVPDDTAVVVVSSAGGLSAANPKGLYLTPENGGEGIVLQAFSGALLHAVSVHAVPLFGPDGLPAGRTTEDRVAAIEQALRDVAPPFPLDHRDTVALTFIDGVSASESPFLEAVYATGRFPLLFIGGSAGGALDFRKTEIADGRTCWTGHAVVVFLKLAPDKRYGVFKTQNFRRLPHRFTVLDGDPARRVVSSVIDPETLDISGFIDAICRTLRCAPADLETRLRRYTFAVDVDGELFVRSVARIDPAADRVTFYCDVQPGDVLHLVEATDFLDQTACDYAAFRAGKPPPLGGVLFDCVLRRLNNSTELARLDLFQGGPVAGFSTFGEVFGIDINQTLSALFFFDAPAGAADHDPWFAQFPIAFARFQLHFQKARHTRLSVLNRLRQGLIQHLVRHSGNDSLLGETVQRIGSCAERVAADDMAGVAAAVLEMHAAFRKAAEDGDAARAALTRREMDLRLAEERRQAAETRALLEARLQRARRLEALGRMAGGLAHEINNLLQPIIGLCELTLEDVPEGSLIADNLAQVIDAARRIHGLTQQVQVFGRSMKSVPHPVALSAALRDAVEVVRPQVPPTIVLRAALGAPAATVLADETHICEILASLVANAVDAIGGGAGEIVVGLDTGDGPGDALAAGTGAAPHAVWWVRDSGCGIAAEALDRVFDPFYTTKGVGEGVGLGLSAVHGLVGMWNGDIAADSVVGQGTTIRIRLPLLAGEGAG